jgi:membrane-associated phospholipid phosphatase
LASVLVTTALTTAIALVACPAGAQIRELRYDSVADLAVTLGGGAAWLVSESFKPQLAPAACRWCAVGALDSGVRGSLVWSDPASANSASNLIAFVAAPLVAVGVDALAASHDGASDRVAVDALLIAEATILAADVNQLTKFLVARERPFVHALPDARKPLTPDPADNDLSFFSGHTTETFALAAAAGTVATMRGYSWAPLAWTAGGALAVTTAYLRIAADKHWLTDVVAGVLLGGAVGAAVPYLLHRPADAPAPSPPQATTAALSFAW